MSFLVLNKTAGSLVINDLGLTIPAATGGSPEPGIFDLTPEDPKQVALSDDLVSQIQAGNLVVLDPLDDVTELSAAVSEEIIRVHNDPHYRIRGGALNQLEDVNLDAAGSPQVLTNKVLQWNNVDAFEPVTPDDLVGDATDAVQDIISSTLVDGNDTTVTYDGSPFTTIQIDVDDVFLRNTGDTLDSGTLTIASGATVDFPSGATITIQDGATATIATPTGGFSADNQLVNKEYVDSVAAGLDPKESVRAATTEDVGGVFTAASPIGPGDAITGASGSIDGVDLVDGDRVLIKDQTDPTQNGIYVASSVTGSPLTATFTRAEDQDGTPSNEVSSGNFTHVEQGTTNINTKWIVTGDGELTLGTDAINWVLFSGPDTIVADVGIARTGNTLALDLSVTEVTTATPALADRIAFHDDDGAGQSPTGTQTYGATFTSTYNAHDVVYGITTNGIIARTADDTYASRTITAAGLGDRDGLEVLDGDGVSGDPTVGLDIENLPYYTTGSPQGTLQTTGRIPVYDPIADVNVYYNVSDVAGALAATNSFETWAGGAGTTGGPVVADSSTDTMTVVGGTGISLTLTAGTDTMQWDLDFAQIPDAGSPLTIDTTDEIIVNNGGTIEKVTLGDLINELGLSTTDELVKISANDTTAGYLNGKLVAGTYTTLVENNDGGNETLTVDIDPSTISIEDLGNVAYGSPTATDGDVLVYRLIGSPQVGTWVNEPAANFGTVDFAFRTVNGDTGSVVANVAEDVISLSGGVGISTAATGSPQEVVFNIDFANLPASGSPLTIDDTDEIIINNGGTVERTTLSDLIDALGLSTTDELVKVSANDTTGGYLNGKLVAGTYTTLTENNDGGNETLTVDTDPSTISLGDLGDVNYGSPLPQAGDILQYGGSPQGWTVVPASTLTFDVCTLSDGSTATLDLTDEIAVCDSGSTVKFSFSDTFDTLGVPTGITSTGIVVKTDGSPATWASRTIVESTNAGEEGAQVNNGDGVAGNIEIGVDINNLTNSADDLATTDELIVYDGTNNVSMSGQQVADGVADILNLTGLSVQPIGGSGSPAQFTLFLTDDVRAKDLSTNEFTLTWSEGNVGNNDWIEIGNANDADVSYVVPMNATIVRATAFSVSAGSSKDINLYIDASLNGTLVTIPSGTNTSVEDVTLDIDVDAGERLRLRGGASGGSIQDTTVVIWLKWRA